jgi:TPR repeat protein
MNKAISAFENKRYEEAFALFLPEAEKGSAEAQAFLGNMYQLGLGVEIQLSEAVKWYERSAAQGYGLASNNLAFIYKTGDDDLPQDMAKAEEFFRQSKEQGFAYGPRTLNY